MSTSKSKSVERRGVIIDTSVIIAYLNSDDTNHIAAKGCLEMAKAAGVPIYLHYLVFAETIKNIRQIQHCSIKLAIKKNR